MIMLMCCVFFFFVSIACCLLQVSVVEHGKGGVKVASVLTEVFGVPGNQTDTGYCEIVREEELPTLLAIPKNQISEHPLMICHHLLGRR